MKKIHEAAVVLGRKGGSMGTEKQKQASRANGNHGGGRRKMPDGTRRAQICVTIDPGVLHDAQYFANQCGIKISRLVDDALRLYLLRRNDEAPANA